MALNIKRAVAAPAVERSFSPKSHLRAANDWAYRFIKFVEQLDYTSIPRGDVAPKMPVRTLQKSARRDKIYRQPDNLPLNVAVTRMVSRPEAKRSQQPWWP